MIELPQLLELSQHAHALLWPPDSAFLFCLQYCNLFSTDTSGCLTSRIRKCFMLLYVNHLLPVIWRCATLWLLLQWLACQLISWLVCTKDTGSHAAEGARGHFCSAQHARACIHTPPALHICCSWLGSKAFR